MVKKGLIYSSEQSNACYQLSKEVILIGDALNVTNPMSQLVAADPYSYLDDSQSSGSIPQTSF